MKKNIFLVFSSLLISIFIIEIILNISGKYENLTNSKLIPSDSIYERPFSSFQKHKHPDLNYIITNYFDEDGVKNFTNTRTSQKKNIIGIFGDSFTENIAIDRQFEYSNVVNDYLKNYQVVNYGVGGYSADQVFLRYIKYRDHDFKHIFYLFMPADTGLATDITFNNDGTYLLKKKKINFIYQVLGKLNITYFAIDLMFISREFISKNHSKIYLENYDDVLANKIYRKFYSNKFDKCIKNKASCDSNFLKLLKVFKKEVESNNSKFYILLYPNNKHIEHFKEIIRNETEDFNYFILNKNLDHNSVNKNYKFQFKNDDHWNEYGNILFAQSLLDIFEKLGIKSKKINKVNIFNDIDLFYSQNKY